jgi:hypothetical protein
MSRLIVHVEGETEEAFVNDLLSSHLYRQGFTLVSARIVGNARQRSRRGGIRAWSAVRKDIINHLREDPGCMATTMVDYYALPQTGARAWPGRERAGALPFAYKAAAVESDLSEDIRISMGESFNPHRFLPFVMMHEFEGMLFSDCRSFANGIGQPELSNALQAIRNQFATPEEINDSPITAPSKRVLQLIPHYDKPLYGTLAAIAIGLDTIRRECPHFREWLTKLEAWPQE